MGKYLDEAGLSTLWQKIKQQRQVEEVATYGDLQTGEAGKIYLVKDTNKMYRWNGTSYDEIAASVVLGETTGTAYDGGKGKDTADKVAAIYEGNLPVVAPVIDGSWSFFKSDGTSPAEISADANNPTIERGFKANFSGTYKWTAAEGYKNPTTVVSAPNAWKRLPVSGHDSARYEQTGIAETTTVQVTLGAPKTGLMVEGTSVQPAKGNDTAQATKTVTFRSRGFYGFLTTNTPSDEMIRKLTTRLQASRTLTVSGVTTPAAAYYIYSYPKELGDLTQIIQDGATPVLSAFTKSTTTMTNDAGAEIEYNIYISNNPGAFTNAKLAFS